MWGVKRWFLSVLLIWIAGQAAARDLYVDPIDGDDRADGLAAKAGDGHGPVKSIAYGLKYAQPGDTVHLRPTAMPYREIPVFHNRHGEPAKPITLDGHGATIEGAEPLKAADWTQVSPGLYRGVPLARIDDPIVQRYFFRIDGRMVHMGRTSKGPRAPWKLKKSFTSASTRRCRSTKPGSKPRFDPAACRSAATTRTW